MARGIFTQNLVFPEPYLLTHMK